MTAPGSRPGAPNDPWPHNNLAWILATATPPPLRDAAGAVRHARRALALAGGPDPFMLDTLAVAQLSAGEQTAALATLEKALRIAQQSGDAETLALLQQSRRRAAAGRLPPMVE